MHIAHTISFYDLKKGIEKAKADKTIREIVDGPLKSYTYTQECQYSRIWNTITLACRGLVIDDERIVATPFPKFFNLGEHTGHLPALPFSVYEKLDGSLIIMYYHNGWRFKTKGSFSSQQAFFAKMWMGTVPPEFNKENTYLFEVIYPENRIVVNYDYEGLVLIGGYNSKGDELPFPQLSTLAASLGLKAAKEYNFKSTKEIEDVAKNLQGLEGFVIRFDNGLRLKVKGDEYTALHKIISGFSPLAIWGMICEGKDLAEYRSYLPEEFLKDFDKIVVELELKISKIVANATKVAYSLKDKTDKEVGLILPTFSEEIRGLIFPIRKNPEKVRSLILKSIRPTGNVL